MKNDQNTTTLIFRRNVMTHIAQPFIWKQPISTFLFVPPNRFSQHDKCFQSIRSQLIVKNNPFIFAYLSKVYISDNLKRNSANNLFCKDLDRKASLFLKVSNYCDIILNIVNINNFRIKFKDVINVRLKIFFDALNHFLNDELSAFNQIRSLVFFSSQKFF